MADVPNERIAAILERSRCAPAAGWLCALLSLGLATPAPAIASDAVSRDRLVAAMRAETGYDRTKTTLAARFQGAVYLRLAREAIRERGEQGALLFIGHEDWYQAYREALGLTAEETPEFVRLSWEHGQDTFIDARAGHVVGEVRGERSPVLALNVRLAWPDAPGAAKSFSFKDLLSVPQVSINTPQEVTFRLLDLGDQIVFDQVDGTKVRPLTGALGVLFKVIGLARVTGVRLAVAADGTTVARAHAKKLLIGVGATVTIAPDGTTEKDIPEDRPDLAAIEQLLTPDLEITYLPYDWAGFEDAVAATAPARLRRRTP